MQVELPFRHYPSEAVVLREKTASSRLSHEEKGKPVILLLDLEDEPNRSSGVRAPRFVVARIDNSSEEEEDGMSLNRKRGLHKLLVDKAKGLAPKDVLGSQPPLSLFLPPPLVNSIALANLKKRKKENKAVEEGELLP